MIGADMGIGIGIGIEIEDVVDEMGRVVEKKEMDLAGKNVHSEIIGETGTNKMMATDRLIKEMTAIAVHITARKETVPEENLVHIN